MTTELSYLFFNGTWNETTQTPCSLYGFKLNKMKAHIYLFIVRVFIDSF